MNELDLLRRLGTRADAEVEPTIDVAGRVIQQITRRSVSVIDRRLSLVSIAACALSLVALAVTWPVKSDNDTLHSLSQAACKSTGPDATLWVLDP
jgi:hypothetical protein